MCDEPVPGLPGSRENRDVPETAAHQAARQAARLSAARRRQAATLLEIAACTARYGAAQLGNGTGPAEARRTAQYVAGELVVVAEALRRLTRPGPGERRALVLHLTELGLPRRRVAELAGVSERTVHRYLRSAEQAQPVTGRGVPAP
jgi:DNA-directed RNA polymerase specialized sigma24 family protein